MSLYRIGAEAITPKEAELLRRRDALLASREREIDFDPSLIEMGPVPGTESGTPTREQINRALGIAIRAMHDSPKRFFGISIRAEGSTLINEYKASDNPQAISDWYGGAEGTTGAIDVPGAILVTYYDREDPDKPIERFVGTILVEEKRTSYLPWILGGVGMLVGLAIFGR